MKHLSPAELTDALDGRLPDPRQLHADACAACAARLVSVRDAVNDVQAADDLPEPSPLFWQHFSQRVSASIRDVTPDPPAWWRHPVWAVACSMVLVIAVVIGVRDTRSHNRGRTPTLSSAQPGPSAELTPSDDPAWNLLTDVASSLEQDDPQAAPVSVRPSEIDRAVVNLSDPEREELRRLLQDEMKRSGD